MYPDFLQPDRMIPFPRVARFTGQSWEWLVRMDTPAHLFEAARFRHELGISNYKPSHVTFTQTWAYMALEAVRMAKAQAKGDKTGDNWKGFINPQLTDDDKTTIKAKWGKFDVGACVQELADCGKVTVSYNPQNNTYNCSVVWGGGELKGWCVSSFADTSQHAIFVTYYKLQVYGDSLADMRENAPRDLFG